MISDLRSYILDDSSISAVIGTRLFPEIAHNITASDPYAIYTTISSNTVDSHSDSGLLHEDLIEVSIHASTVSQIYDLAELFRTRLNNKRVALGSYDAYIKWSSFNTDYSDNDEIFSGSITLDVTWS